MKWNADTTTLGLIRVAHRPVVLCPIPLKLYPLAINCPEFANRSFDSGVNASIMIAADASPGAKIQATDKTITSGIVKNLGGDKVQLHDKNFKTTENRCVFK